MGCLRKRKEEKTARKRKRREGLKSFGRRKRWVKAVQEVDETEMTCLEIVFGDTCCHSNSFFFSLFWKNNLDIQINFLKGRKLFSQAKYDSFNFLSRTRTYSPSLQKKDEIFRFFFFSSFLLISNKDNILIKEFSSMSSKKKNKVLRETTIVWFSAEKKRYCYRIGDF